MYLVMEVVQTVPSFCFLRKKPYMPTNLQTDTSAFDLMKCSLSLCHRSLHGGCAGLPYSHVCHNTNSNPCTAQYFPISKCTNWMSFNFRL